MASEDIKAVLAVVEALQAQVNSMSQELHELKKGHKEPLVQDEVVLSDKDSCTILPKVIWIRFLCFLIRNLYGHLIFFIPF